MHDGYRTNAYFDGLKPSPTGEMIPERAYFGDSIPEANKPGRSFFLTPEILDSLRAAGCEVIGLSPGFEQVTGLEWTGHREREQ